MSRPGHEHARSETALPAWRLALAFVLGVVLAGTTLVAVLRAVALPPASELVRPPPPLTARLASHVALVIVDGLRYDVATNRALMPHFAGAMESDASGEIWAGQVSMTSSAILAIGTGQPGRLEHVINNVNPPPATFNSWLANATVSGLRIGVVGDRTWTDLFGRYIGQSRLDPEGVAIDVDFNPAAFKGSRELVALAPDALVLHFGTPDHQGHAYGIRSDRYRAHIRRFDDELAAFLKELPPDFTVIVTSDHGAADSGTHGADVPIQRRSPIYAYGPGIRPGEKLTEPADQLDLAATLAILLGVSAPAHGIGHVLPFLDLPEERRATLACAQADGVLAYASTLVTESTERTLRASLELCRSSGDPAVRSRAALVGVRGAAAAVRAATGLSSPDTPMWALGIAVIAIALSFLLLPEIGPKGHGVVLAVLTITVALVYEVERLPGVWPNAVRGVFFFVTNAVLALLLLVPSEIATWLRRHRGWALAVCPASLVVSYPANTCPEAYFAAAVLAVVLVGYGELAPGIGRYFRGYASRASLGEIASLVVGILLLFPVALRPNGTYSELLPAHARTIVTLLVAGYSLVWLGRRATLSWMSALLLAAGGVAAIAARPAVGAYVGRAAWFGLTTTFAWLSYRGERRGAVIAGALAVLAVSRDFEAVPLFGALLVADVVGAAARARREASEPGPDLFPRELLLVGVHFSLAYAFRIGAQDGLEFGGMYWGAGAFNDPGVSSLLIGGALTFKYAMGVLLVGLALQGAWPESRVELGAREVAVSFVVRSLSLAAMFLLSGNSYWTALRVIGDLPTALACMLGALLYSLVARAQRTVYDGDLSSSASSRVFTEGHSVSRMLK